MAAAAGVSRQQAKGLITGGLVKVNGEICKQADAKFTAPRLAINGKETAAEAFVYIMLNKPVGVVSASEDKHDTTVVDLVRETYPRRPLFPVGRLDKASEGFVLLTDDGPFGHRVLAPKSHLPKVYEVTLDTPFTKEMAAGFAAGLTLADGTKVKPATATPAKDPFTCTVVLQEGKYHQIKRMFGLFNAGVNALKRTHIGAVALDETLAPGAYRPLAAGELESLQTAVANTKIEEGAKTGKATAPPPFANAAGTNPQKGE